MAETPFLKGALLDTIVPQASEAHLEDILGSSSGDYSEDSLSILSAVGQRDLLFFDELVTVYVVLRLTNCSEDALRSQLRCLVVKLEAFAVNSEDLPHHRDDGDAEQTKDMLYSGAVQNTEDPLVIVHQVEGDDEVDNYVFVIWKSEAFLNRPRVRLQHPSVLLVASATLNQQRAPGEPSDDEYLPSLTPSSANVLQSLSSAQGSFHPDLSLPASRLLRVLPAARLETEDICSIQQQSCNPFRVIPIASARVRYSHLNTYSSQPTTIASLEFEVTPFTGFEVVLEGVELTLSNGKVENLTQVTECAPPINCQSRDDVTLVYKLIPDDTGGGPALSNNYVSTLNINLRATILISDDCRPKIMMQWKSNVEFGTPGQGLSRPPSSSSGANRQSYSSTDFGVTISFSGPPLVHVGKPFNWDVLIVNRSDKTRKFAMVAIPRRRRRSDARKHGARPSASSITSVTSGEFAEAVADDNIVYAMQKNAFLYDAQVVSLSTDIRVGPLPPGTCQLAELKLVALAPGPLHIDAVRLIDLATNDSVDIQSLPNIIAYSGETE